MQTIGFIGLGNMGGNMAARYLAAGYTVYGEDRDRADAQWLVDQGLRWVEHATRGRRGGRRRHDLPPERRRRRVGRRRAPTASSPG